MKHKCKDCDHDLCHCSECDVVYCKKCGKEWNQDNSETWTTTPCLPHYTITCGGTSEGFDRTHNH